MLSGIDPFAGSQASLAEVLEVIQRRGVAAARAEYERRWSRDDDPWLGLAVSLLLFAEGEPAKATDLLCRLLNRVRAVPGPHLLAIHLLLHAGEVEAALAALDKARERWPEAPAVAAYAGWLFLHLGEAQAARAALEALPAQRRDAAVLAQMASASLWRAAWADALDYADAALGLCGQAPPAGRAPDPAALVRATVWIARAMACLHLGRHDEALAATELAEESMPVLADPIAVRIQILIARGEPEPALALLDSLPEEVRGDLAALREQALFRAGLIDEGNAALTARRSSLPSWERGFHCNRPCRT